MTVKRLAPKKINTQKSSPSQPPPPIGSISAACSRRAHNFPFAIFPPPPFQGVVEFFFKGRFFLLFIVARAQESEKGFTKLNM
jgi:hypothetical protein